MTNPTSSASTQPSSAYIFALSAGATGLPFLGIGLGGALIGRAGGDPVRAFDVDGMVMFLLAFAIGFAIRLIFWPPAPPSLRSAVRTIVTIIFAIGIPAAIAGLILSVQLPAALPHRVVPICFSTLALVCQPGAILWLARYRPEGI